MQPDCQPAPIAGCGHGFGFQIAQANDFFEEDWGHEQSLP
jgi:hypothetical protein